jgi:hypothetical protein
VFAQVVPLAQHVVLVIDENTSFSTVYPNGMPWLVSEGNKNGYAANYSSDVSGSPAGLFVSGFGKLRVGVLVCGGAGVQHAFGKPQF